jgi:hypothetical protein
MVEYLAPAIASLKAAKDIASTLLDLRDIDKITTATIDLKSRLVQTYDYIISEKERALALQDRVSKLEKECDRLKDWSADREKYSRRQIGTGVFTYIDSPCQGELQNAHKLCCNCFDKTIKSTLQQSHGHSRSIILTCPNGCPPLQFYYYSDQGA